MKTFQRDLIRARIQYFPTNKCHNYCIVLKTNYTHPAL